MTPGNLTVISANSPMVDSGEMVIAATVPPKLLAFSARATKILVSPDPEPMINKSSFSKLAVTVSPTT